MFSKESLKSLGHKINFDGVTVDSEQAKIIKAVAIQAARWGMFLQHQTQYSSAWKRTVIGLFKKNFPEESIPEDLPEKLDSLIDESSGKSFGEILHEQMVDDWANTECTLDATFVLEHTAHTLPPEEFISNISNVVNKFKEPLQLACRMKTQSEAIN